MIKVCHVTSVHQRYDTRIFHKECTSLAKAGYDVTLLVADNKAPEVRNGVKIISADFKPKSRWDRIMYSSSVMFKYAMEVNAEIYHLHDPELLPAAKKLKQRAKKVIFDSHEDVPGVILKKQWIPWYLKKTCAEIYSIYANYVLQKLDYLIAATPHVVEFLRSVNANVALITNYPIIDDKSISLRNSEYLTGEMSKTIVYAGGISEQWSHENILKAIENMDIKYELAGVVTHAYLEKLQEYSSWGKVVYHGKVPHDEVNKLFSKSSVGLAILQPSFNTNGKIGNLSNTKLFEYLAAGLPVICTNFKIWSEIIKKWKCGICVDPNNTTEIHDAIEYLVNNPHEAMKMGKNGQKAIIDEFNWQKQEQTLINTYKNIS